MPDACAPPHRRSRDRSRGRARTAAATAGPALLLAGCSQGGLDPAGAEAGRIATIFWALTIVGGVVTAVVVGLWAWGALRPRGDAQADDPRPEHVADPPLGRRFVIGGGIVMPAIVLAAFFGVQIVSTTAQPQEGDLTIEVTGHQFWWEVDYAGIDGVEPFETANQVHVPTGTSVTVVLRSDDVIHSLWVPELAGKMDLVPGRANRFTFTADTPGTYAGYCAEYCGLQHAWMKFSVVAMEPAAFRAWAEDQAAPAAQPTTEAARRGRDVFEGQSCVGCHTIRGVAEEGDLGPDLTHLASRDRIGAGIRELTEDDLRAWIANAQAIKPGARMPPQELTDDELDDLVTYLLDLE